jgi:retron-type reverse transcriptase
LQAQPASMYSVAFETRLPPARLVEVAGLDGYQWVAAVDLAQFFDRVNHDVLMSRLAKRIEDERLLG